MKKIIKRFFLVLILVVLIYACNYAWRAFPIISGYGAKNLCTCVFVADRSVESVLENELGTFPLSLGSFTVDKENKSASGTVLGAAAKKAVYREGLGCTLLSEVSEKDFSNQARSLQLTSILSHPDSLPWPYGATLNTGFRDSLNLEQLQNAIDNAFVEDNPEKVKNTRAVVIVQNGQLLAEQYAEGFDAFTPQIGWSMTKSITNAMLGLLVKDGLLDIHKPAPIPEWESDDDPRSEITIDHLLRMSSGLQWEENYASSSSATNMLFKRADMGQAALEAPLAYEPDTKWYYSSGTSNILSKIVRKTIGDDKYHAYVRQRLFSPLGTNSVVIEPDASGTYVGSSYMYATPRDWSKFGLLFLSDGIWNGERILPEGWVRYSSTPTPDAKGRYGAHFWLNAGVNENGDDRWLPDVPTDVYSMNGYEGQRVFIIPSKNAVVVRMGLSKRGAFDFNQFLKEVIDALPE